MNTPQDYKGFVIEPDPEELEDGSGWTDACIIKINRFEGEWFGSDRRFPTRAEATSASILAAKGRIDRSLDKLGTQRTDVTDVTPYDDLSATWAEEEHPLAGAESLYHTKDNRRRRLDEVDDTPE